MFQCAYVMIVGLVVYDAPLLRVCALLDQGLRVSQVTCVVNNMSTYGGVHVLHLRLHSHVDGCEQMADKEVGGVKPKPVRPARAVCTC